MTRWADERVASTLAESLAAHEHLADPGTAHRIAAETLTSPGERPRHSHGRLLVAGVAATVAAVAVAVPTLSREDESVAPSPPAASGAPSGGPSVTEGTYAQNLTAARAASVETVRSLRMPGGARELDRRPADWPEGGSSLGPSDPALTRTRWWSVPMGPVDLGHWLAQHTPEGLVTDGGVGRSLDAREMFYDPAPGQSPVGYLGVSVILTWRQLGGRTFVEAQTFTSARNVRPAASYVDGSVTAVDIARIVRGSDQHPGGRRVPTVHLRAATDAAQVARLVRAANALPGSVAVGWSGSCPMIPDPPPEFTITFHTAAATLSMRQVLGCWGLVEVTRDGQAVTPPLDPGGLSAVVNDVAASARH